MTTHVNPANVVAPTDAVAEASLRIISEFVMLRKVRGPHAAQVEAMAMHNAAIAVLRPDIGAAGVQQMLDLAAAENERIRRRDDRGPPP